MVFVFHLVVQKVCDHPLCVAKGCCAAGHPEVCGDLCCTITSTCCGDDCCDTAEDKVCCGDECCDTAAGKVCCGLEFCDAGKACCAGSCCDVGDNVAKFQSRVVEILAVTQTQNHAAVEVVVKMEMVVTINVAIVLTKFVVAE